jgi:hypothetical protein
MRNYFKDRTLSVKIGDVTSTSCNLSIGVPQGSVLGPLLFLLIFINDLPYSVQQMSTKMFADDTTIYTSGNNIDSLIVDFKRNVDEFIFWCAYNRMDINWSKTKLCS